MEGPLLAGFFLSIFDCCWPAPLFRFLPSLFSFPVESFCKAKQKKKGKGESTDALLLIRPQAAAAVLTTKEEEELRRQLRGGKGTTVFS